MPTGSGLKLKKEIIERARFAYQYLVDNGIAPHIAKGFIGNLMQESMLNPRALNKSGAYGIAQWLGSRKRGLFEFAKMRGAKPDDFVLQLDYLIHELRTTEKHTYKKLLNARDANEATIYVMKYYERPGEHEAMPENRLRYTSYIHDLVDNTPVEQVSNDLNLPKPEEIEYTNNTNDIGFSIPEYANLKLDINGNKTEQTNKKVDVFSRLQAMQIIRNIVVR